MSTDVKHANPFAALADDPDAPDPKYVARERELLTALCTIFAAGNTADGEWYIDENICASTWLDAIAEHAYQGGAE